MRFPGKKARTAGRVNFDDYNWDGFKATGWWRAVVLGVEEKQTAKGDDMLVITFGLDTPDETIGGRCRHWVPESYPPKVIELAEVFQPALLEQDDDGELDSKALRFRRCALLLEEDPDYQRDDGQTAYQVKKLLTLEQADADLGAGWDEKVMQEAPTATDEDDGADDLF